VDGWVGGRAERAQNGLGRYVWSPMPLSGAPGQFGMVWRGLVGRLRGKTPKGFASGFRPVRDLKASLLV
jgi:hypothetical protein